jgi:N-formylglutamate amidohydrolase
MTRDAGENERTIRSGGRIPGLPGAAAFTLIEPEPSPLPVLIAVPHAGRAYPPALVERLRNPAQAALRLEDRCVDLLAREIARATGAALLVAEAPRAMIDLNRAPDDVDWEMFPRAKTDPAHPLSTHRARSGLGLIPRRLPGLGELWTRRHERAELEARIAAIHAPYHACLDAVLAGLRARWGAALLVDLHSMPSLPVRHGLPGAEFVLGDRFGTSCDGSLAAASFAYFAGESRRVAHNRPYAGGYGLERHAAPRAGIHALQLEIDRASYLDSQLAAPGEQFHALATLLEGLVTQLGEATAALGRGESGGTWAEAAE